MWGTKLYYKHKWVIGGVVEEGTCEGEVSGSNPTDHVARDFTWKNARLFLKSFFPIFENRFHIFYQKISTGVWHNWTACRNACPQAVVSYPPVEKIISTGHQTQAVRQTACKKGFRTACIVPLCTSEFWAPQLHLILFQYNRMSLMMVALFH